MGGAITESRTIGEQGVVQQRPAISLLDTVHFLNQVCKLFHVKLIHPEEIFDILGLVVGHAMVALWFVEQTVKHVGSIPALRAHHESSNMRQTCLQCDHHEFPHQTKEFTPWKVGLGWLLNITFCQGIPHDPEPLHLLFDHADGFKVFIKRVLIVFTKASFQPPGILQNQIGDFAKSQGFLS